MEEIKLNLIEDIDLVKEKGDAIMVLSRHSQTGEQIQQLIICCPGCGKRSGSAGNHVFDPTTQNYTPSIIHDKSLGGCG